MITADCPNDERFCELAQILAAAILRLRIGAVFLGDDRDSEEDSPESSPTCLEVPEETVLSVHTS